MPAALPAIPADYSGVSVRTYSVLSIPPKCETAGLAFYDKVERHHYQSLFKACDSSDDLSNNKEAVRSDSVEGSSSSVNDERRKKNYKENSSISQRVRQVLENGADLYSLICLPHSATTEDIRKQWRKLAIIFHPDKSATTASGTVELIEGLPDVTKMTAEELNKEFLDRHNAFEILVDPITRRQYDSYAEFDDRLPTELEINLAAGESPEAFFKLCRPAFEKESRWCVKQPIPDLGDMETSLDAVKEFYKYWANYESWRDFGNAGEYNLEEAQDREERKWMQKENWKVVKALLKAERQRVLSFVTAAEAKDPRLALAKEKLRAAKAAAAPKAGAAKSKAKSLQEVKAAILARRKKLTDGRQLVRQVVRNWIVEKLETKDEEFSKRLDQFLGKDELVEEISDLAHKITNITKRYKEPTREGAVEVKALIEKSII